MSALVNCTRYSGEPRSRPLYVRNHGTQRHLLTGAFRASGGGGRRARGLGPPGARVNVGRGLAWCVAAAGSVQRRGEVGEVVGDCPLLGQPAAERLVDNDLGEVVP